MLATSTTNSQSIEYPLANLSASFNKPEPAQLQSLLSSIQPTISVATPANTPENSKLFTGSTTNTSALPLAASSLNPAISTHSITANSHSSVLTTPIDHPEWRQKFSEQILFLSRQGSQQAELLLHP
ncbi:MAG: hypothetical protein AB8W37_08470 [Arsenophonus endosymbiont of Dermacentor nuttalli]